ncbi:MAG: hypothetical protein PSX36_15695 [bacterium]|nr:hypothetical protein [bacterium]
MNIKGVYLVSGYLSVLVGVLAAACIFRINWMYYGVALSFVGMILSIINIFLNTKYYFDQEKFPKGYLGLFLSSLPVIFMMLIIFKFKK